MALLPLCESNSTLFIPDLKRQTCSDLPPTCGKPPETPQTQAAKFATNVLAAKLTPQTGATGERSAFTTHLKLITESFQELRSEHFAPKPSKAAEARK